MNRIDENKIEQLCGSLGYRVSGLLDLSFKPSFGQDYAVVKVVLRMDGIDRPSQLVILETVCRRAVTHLADARRRIRSLSAETGIEIKIQEN